MGRLAIEGHRLQMSARFTVDGMAETIRMKSMRYRTALELLIVWYELAWMGGHINRTYLAHFRLGLRNTD
jgi:hypothetical protein